jgi:hypothetical protein
MASLGGVRGGEGDVSLACSLTMVSMDRGSMVEAIVWYTVWVRTS